MPPLPTCARIPHRSLISLTGAHATQFLNGILTLGPPVPPQGGFFTAFLHAQGRVLYDAFVYREPESNAEDGYMIEFDSRPSSAPSLLDLLKRYILRSKVKVRDVSNQWDVWAAWGIEFGPDDRKWRWSRSGAVEPVWVPDSWPWGGTKNPFSILDRRARGMGRRMLVRKGDTPLEVSNYGVAPSEAYTAHRILHGVPEGVIDIPPLHAFPMESNLDVMGAIDFRKGCYIGQELTVRTYHTGVVRKRILPIEIHPSLDDSPAKASSPGLQPTILTPGLDIRLIAPATLEGKGPRPRGTGKLLSSIGNIGLALLRLEHVEAVSRGHAAFQMVTGEEGHEKQTWRIVNSWPSGWPSPGINEVD
ncbi:Aminomethyltransferase folate-binding domain-containing protein [Gautieria morchelliformis]|nr:Aminomethyltransferase folate-binding domain-containing protein [Gautieria morchelliformis]